MDKVCEATTGRDWYYNVYLKSDHWKKVRQETLDRDGHRCVICGGQNSLNVHHLRYDYTGCEYPSDLVTLCEQCHGELHRLINAVWNVKSEMDFDFNRRASVALTELAQEHREDEAYIIATIAYKLIGRQHPSNTAKIVSLVRDTIDNRATKHPIEPNVIGRDTYTMASMILSRMRDKKRVEEWMVKASGRVSETERKVNRRNKIFRRKK